MKKIKWNNILKSFIRSLTSYPVELSTGVICTIVMIYMEFSYPQDSFTARYLTFGLSIAIAYLLNLCFPTRKHRWVYFMAFPLAIGLQYLNLDTWTESVNFYVTCILTCFGIIIARATEDNKAFSINVVYLIVDLFLTGVLSLILYVITLLIYLSIGHIFQIPAQLDWFNDFVELVTYIIFPSIALIIFFAIHQQRSVSTDFGKYHSIQILLNYILSPAILIYTVILYIYIFTILFRWELPQGEVTYLVFSFLMISLIAKPLQNLLTKQPFQLFYKYLPAIAAAPLILFWVGYMYRIGQYGFTTMRIYLGLTGIWLTFTMVLLAIKPNLNFRFLILFGITIIACFTYVPTWSAQKLAINSQRKELVKQVNQITAQQNKNTLADLDWNQVNSSTIDHIQGTYDYLINENDTLWLQQNTKVDLATLIPYMEKAKNLSKPIYRIYKSDIQSINVNSPSTIYFEPKVVILPNDQEPRIYLSDTDSFTLAPETYAQIKKTLNYKDGGAIALTTDSMTYHQNDTIITFNYISFINDSIQELIIYSISTPQ